MKNVFPDDKEILARIVKNKNVVRAQLRRLSLNDIEKFIEVASEVHVEKKTAEAEKAEEVKRRAKRIEELKQQMKEYGISPEDLAREPAIKRGRPKKIDQSESESRTKQPGFNH